MSSPWTLDKKIPLALVFAILMQTVAAIWWASGLQGQVQANSKDIRQLRLEIDATSSLRSDMAEVKNDIGWIKGWLEKYGR
ncbi:hypothetical protein [Pseudodesulfovibrio tunisiensis]|uniref:hypothetical protein n=1 Tax=Pseudodesulfovibrio tunisiensis TaxID=463192 RepID=UPI001FB52EB2|nr:hypothetical protein [Pseudodesulfovibrio tunisiensis]